MGERKERAEKAVPVQIARSVGPHFTAYMQQLVESGRYISAAEVLREAMRLHESCHTPAPAAKEVQS